MTRSKIESIEMVGSSGEEHVVADVRDFRVNAETGIIEIVRDGGSFALLLDRLRHFKVHFSSPREQPAAYKKCDVTLTALNGTPPRPVTLTEVIGFDWKADQGLFMVFCKGSTFGVHLDHLVSFTVEKSPTAA